MKRKILHISSVLLIGAVCLLGACSGEEDLFPSGNDSNQFEPAADDQSRIAQLRRSFFEETGIYLLFSDTLHHEQNGTNAYGQPTFDTDVVDFNYNLTSDNSYTLRFEYYETYEEMQTAVEAFKNYYLPHMGESMYPYSLLLLKKMENKMYSYSDYEEIASASNIYCMGINTGDLASLTEEDIKTTAHEVFKEMVDNSIDNLDWDDYKGPFYDVTESNSYEYLGTLIPGWDRTQMDQLYELGFIDIYEDWYDEYYYDEPRVDWDDWFEMVMDTDWEELKATYGQYNLIMQQLDIVRNAILATGYVF